MNDISSFWMTNYEKWRCPLNWLISSGQMFECLICHFKRQARMVICPMSYLDLYQYAPPQHTHMYTHTPVPCTKSASSYLPSQCPISTVSVCVCIGGWLEGLPFNGSVEMNRLLFLWLKFCRTLQGQIFVLWENTVHLQLKVHNSNSICHGLYGSKIKTFSSLLNPTSFTLTTTHFFEMPFNPGKLSIWVENNSETYHLLFCYDTALIHLDVWTNTDRWWNVLCFWCQQMYEAAYVTLNLHQLLIKHQQVVITLYSTLISSFQSF